jgi:hypothetical protein
MDGASNPIEAFITNISGNPSSHRGIELDFFPLAVLALLGELP